MIYDIILNAKFDNHLLTAFFIKHLFKMRIVRELFKSYSHDKLVNPAITSRSLIKASKDLFLSMGTLILITVISTALPGCVSTDSLKHEVSNSAFLLRVTVNKPEIHVTLEERQIPLRLSEGNYIYRSQVSGSRDTVFTLDDPEVTVSGKNLTIHGKIAGLDIEQSYYLPSDKPFIE